VALADASEESTEGSGVIAGKRPEHPAGSKEAANYGNQ